MINTAIRFDTRFDTLGMELLSVLQWPKFYKPEWLYFKKIKLDSVVALSLPRWGHIIRPPWLHTLVHWWQEQRALSWPQDRAVGRPLGAFSRIQGSPLPLHHRTPECSGWAQPWQMIHGLHSSGCSSSLVGGGIVIFRASATTKIWKSSTEIMVSYNLMMLIHYTHTAVMIGSISQGEVSLNKILLMLLIHNVTIMYLDSISYLPIIISFTSLSTSCFMLL